MVRILPTTFLFISVLIMLFVHFLAPIREVTQYSLQLLGIIPLSTGVILNLIANAAFKKAGTTVKPFEVPTSLITTGAFRISRHPMYLGMLLILLGIAVMLGSLAPFIVLPVFGSIIELVFVRAEENMLEEQFGATWKSYQSKVRKWL